MKQSLFVLFLLTFTTKASALYSTMTTGELLSKKQYKVQAESQVLTNFDHGLNLLGRFEMNLREDANFIGVLGFGTTDFQAEAYYKWVPFPDVDQQPAIGLMAGVNTARYEDVDEFGVRFHPFISKHLSIDIGDLTPYTSLPIGFESRDGQLDVPIQIVLGSRIALNDIEWGAFYYEMGFDLHEAFSYVSVSVEFLLER